MSSNASEQLNVLVRLSSDQAAVQRVKTDIQSVKTEAVQLASDFGKLGPVAAAGVDVIESKFGLLDERVALARQEIRDFESGLERVGSTGAESLERITAGARESSEELQRLQRETTNTGSSRIDAGRIGSVGGQILGGLGQSGAANSVGLIADTAEALTTLNPAMLAYTAALGAGGLVVSSVSRIIEENTNRQRAYADALLVVADVTTRGTTTAIESQIAALEIENTIRETQIQLIERQTGATRDQLRQLQETDAGDITLLGMIQNFVGKLEGFSGSADSVREAETTIERNTFLIEALRTALADGVTTTNDAIAHAETNTAAWEDINRQLMGQMEAAFNADRARLDFVREIDQATADQRAQLAADLREQRDDLQAAVDTFRGSGWEGLPEAEANLTQVNEQLEMLGVVSNSTADRLEAARVAQEQYNSLYDTVFDAISDTVDAQARAAQAQQNYNEAVAESDAKFGQLTQEILARTQKIEVDTQKAISTVQSDAAEKRVEIEQDLNEKLVEVRKNYARSELNAVRDRNADALEQAQTQRDDQEDSAEKAANKQQVQLEKALSKQVQTTRERFDEQTRAQRESFDRQFAQLAEATNREKVTRQRALDQANVDLYNARQIESALNRQFYSNEYTMRAQANAVAAIQAYEGGRYAGAQWAAGALVGVTGNQVNTFPPLNAIPTQNVTNVINIGGVGSGQQLTSTQQAQVIGLVRSITAD